MCMRAVWCSAVQCGMCGVVRCDVLTLVCCVATRCCLVFSNYRSYLTNLVHSYEKRSSFGSEQGLNWSFPSSIYYMATIMLAGGKY